MSTMVACCGLDCARCPSLLATKSDDDAARARTAAFLAEKYGLILEPRDINCDGCLAVGGRLLAYCRGCEVRRCCRAKGLDGCLSCGESPCEALERFHAFSPDAKASFDALRARSS
jgi:hypothetical protein